MSVAIYSAELSAVNNILKNGTKIEDFANFTLSPTYVMSANGWDLDQPEIEHPSPPDKQNKKE